MEDHLVKTVTYWDKGILEVQQQVNIHLWQTIVTNPLRRDIKGIIRVLRIAVVQNEEFDFN